MSLSCSVLTFYPVPSPERLLPIPSCCPSRSSLSGNPEIARFSSFLSGRACVPTFKLSQSPGLFFSQIQIILPLNCHRNTPRRGCTHRVPRGPFCQLCLQRGHCLSRCPLREGLMFLGHVSMMLQLPNEPEEPGRISRPSDYTHNRPNWRRRRRWLNASRRVRERIARRRGSMYNHASRGNHAAVQSVPPPPLQPNTRSAISMAGNAPVISSSFSSSILYSTYSSTSESTIADENHTNQDRLDACSYVYCMN